MTRLHRGDDIELLESIDIVVMDKLRVLDSVPSIARTVCLDRLFVRVEDEAVCAIADRVDADLESGRVAFGDHLVQSIRRHQQEAAISRVSAIGSQHGC